MILLIAVFLVSLINRLLVIRGHGVDYDTYGHLYYAKAVRDQKAGPFGSINAAVVGSENFRHPFLWHWIIGKLSLAFFNRYKKIINAILDSLFTVVLYVIIVNLFGEKVGLLSAAIYLFTPGLFSSISTGPRIKSLTPRITSEIAVNIYFSLWFFEFGLPVYVKFSLLGIFGTYTLVSSKFGIQALVFLTLLYSLISLSLYPIIALIACVCLGALLSRGQFFRTIKYHMLHLKWYFFKNLKGETVISNRNDARQAWSRASKFRGAKKFVTFSKYLLSKNIVGILLLKIPIVVLFITLFATGLFNCEVEVFHENYTYLVLAVIILYALVNIPVLLFIGEAERYVNHVMLFVILATVQLALAMDLEWTLYVVISIGGVYWLAEAVVLRRHLYKLNDIQRKSEVERKILAYLNERDSGLRIMCYPYHAVGIWRLMYSTSHQIVGIQNRADRDEFERLYGDVHPFLNLDRIDLMIENLGLNFIIIDNSKLLQRHPNGWEPSENWSKLDLADPIYSLYIHSSAK